MRKFILIIVLGFMLLSCGARKVQKTKETFKQETTQVETVATEVKEQAQTDSLTNETVQISGVNLKVLPDEDYSESPKDKLAGEPPPPKRKLEFTDNKGNKMTMDLNPTDKLIYGSTDSVYNKLQTLEERFTKLEKEQKNSNITQTTETDVEAKHTEREPKLMSSLGWLVLIAVIVILVVLIIKKQWQNKLRKPF